jgi:hypothetical protein
MNDGQILLIAVAAISLLLIFSPTFPTDGGEE